MVAIPLVLLVVVVVVVDCGCRVAGCILIFDLDCEASTVIVLLHIKMPTAAAKSNFILMPIKSEHRRRRKWCQECWRESAMALLLPRVDEKSEGRSNGKRREKFGERA